MRALLDLALRFGEGPIQSRDIHQRHAIDENYLNQILILLRKAGLIESQRGPQGGHRLARHPAKITLLEIVTTLEGPLLVSEAAERVEGDRIDREVVRGVWADIRGTLEAQLAALTLDDLCSRRRQKAGEVMYYI